MPSFILQNNIPNSSINVPIGTVCIMANNKYIIVSNSPKQYSLINLNVDKIYLGNSTSIMLTYTACNQLKKITINIIASNPEKHAESSFNNDVYYIQLPYKLMQNGLIKISNVFQWLNDPDLLFFNSSFKLQLKSIVVTKETVYV
jgi:hypothetical protein